MEVGVTCWDRCGQCDQLLIPGEFTVPLGLLSVCIDGEKRTEYYQNLKGGNNI